MAFTTNMHYVELHARSAFSFLRGASLPEQLAERAAELDLPAVALCDRAGVYGAPRFFSAAREAGFRPLIGAELVMEDQSVLPVLVESKVGYQNLCRLLTTVHLRSAKGDGRVRWEELPEQAAGLVALTGDEEGPLVQALRQGEANPLEVLSRLTRAFGEENVFVEVQRHHHREEEFINRQLMQLAARGRVGLLATNGVCYAREGGRRVLDTQTCIRQHTHLDQAGRALTRNGQRHLKDGASMRELFRDLPEAIENTLVVADRLQFSLENLDYTFPRYPVPEGVSMDRFLEQQVWAGARRRYGEVPERVERQLHHELGIIRKLGFAGYFLIVWDITQFCRQANIMVQGRGSAANSAVCYCLGITAVDPVGANLLFERFLSEGRKGWPDIDLDLPSGDRREQVIQEVYRRYGPRGAAMTANVITFRGRSAAREIGKALNFAPDVIDRFANLFADGDFPQTLEAAGQLEQAGHPLDHPRSGPFLELYAAMFGLPRHLGQHSGGLIICQGRLDSIVPLENASMPGRVVAQWNKDDCEDLGIIKVDLLGLGMMSVLQDTIELAGQRGRSVELATIPKDDGATFEMMQRADTIGVFQIESRAQMATLPRLQPKTFYDVVIEVALIRPGPIQGDLVHPYLARRTGQQPVEYLDERLRPVLERTLGVPLFQEQMLKIAMVMADFSGNEAEELRRALSYHRSQERMEGVCRKLAAGMTRNKVAPEVATKIVQAIASFALYGFPESHAISFAILSYASAYLKVHYAPEFYASLLNNQPMGFYSSDTLIKDAKRHRVKVRPVCVARSGWNCLVEPDNSLRLGLRVVQGLRQESGRALLQQRQAAPFGSMADFKRRVPLNEEERRRLAEIGALNCLAPHRRAALWQIEAPDTLGELFDATSLEEAPLPPMSFWERLQSDYEGMRLSTGTHPMSLVRARLPDVWRAADLARAQPGQSLRIAGAVICRQRPGTAKGFVFVSLEDETGVSNAIVPPTLFEERRLVLTQEPFLVMEGLLQKTQGVVVLKARRIEPLPYRELMAGPSHDFR